MPVKKYTSVRKKKKVLKKKSTKKIGQLLNKVYINFKKKQKENEKKDLKLKEDQIKKGNEKIK